MNSIRIDFNQIARDNKSAGMRVKRLILVDDAGMRHELFAHASKSGFRNYRSNIEQKFLHD